MFHYFREYLHVLRAITLFFYLGKLGRYGKDRMAVGFTISCAISAYHH
jgi:hypothetical protein